MHYYGQGIAAYQPSNDHTVDSHDCLSGRYCYCTSFPCTALPLPRALFVSVCPKVTSSALVLSPFQTLIDAPLFILLLHFLGHILAEHE